MKLIKVQFREPLEEGKVPKTYCYGPDGSIYECVPEQEDYDDPFDGEVGETDTYFLTGREEYWGFETNCKNCGTKFMAYNENKNVRNYCPGCGKQLVKA